MLINEQKIKIAIIGLGYVGLPVALEFSKHFPVVGFDIDVERIKQLRNNIDSNGEIESANLLELNNIIFSSKDKYLRNCNVYIVTVPTPIDRNRNPNLQPIKSASMKIAKQLKPGNVVIYESTVYPGAIEEVCVPLLKNGSSLKFNKEFYVGYSPERLNPGDKNKSVKDIIKITSGSTPEASEFIDYLYKKIVSAGTHKVSSIKIAEAAKVIENTQRDLNIALINELAIIFNKLNLDTKEILIAASTKWNFMPFNPGLVGGRCIGVDPYYLTYKAQTIGYTPEVILAGRRINDNMGKYVVSEVIKKLLAKKIHVLDANILIMGSSFKENCSDMRNTRVVDILNELKEYGANVTVFEPYINSPKPLKGNFDCIIIAVAHDYFKKMGINAIHALGKANHVVYDVKHLFPKIETDGRL